ncbi:GNAT family N-acetyltransferase [Actinophytocola sediminis]
MYHVRTASPADLPGVIELIARLQLDSAHNIAFHGESPAEVADELANLGGDWADLAVVAADENGRLRGVLSVEVVHDGTRVFLHGPYVDVPAKHPAAGQLWQRTADDLFAAASALPAMTAVTTVDLLGHRDNRLLADFAVRHDIPAGKTVRVFTLAGAGLRSLVGGAADAPPRKQDRVVVLPADPAVHTAVAGLHDRLFPNAPTPGTGLVSGAAGHTVVVLLGEGLLGYAAGYLQAEEYYVDAVGVDQEMRGIGIGRLLVRRLLTELAAKAARERASATIDLGNDASERLFTALGFGCRTELVNYRRADFGVAGHG